MPTQNPDHKAHISKENVEKIYAIPHYRCAFNRQSLELACETIMRYFANTAGFNTEMTKAMLQERGVNVDSL
jgi:alanyl-tRNA synthetase